MKLAGIDLGWKGKGTNSAMTLGELRNNALYIIDVITPLRTTDEVARALSVHSDIFGLAIDAPMIVNNCSGQRPCERSLSSDWIP